MTNIVKFKLTGVTEAIVNQYLRITDTSRVELMSGNTLNSDSSGNVEIDVTSVANDGDLVIVYGDSYPLSGTGMKGFNYIGLVEEKYIDWGSVEVDLSSIALASWFTTGNTVYADGTTTFDTSSLLDGFTGTQYYVGFAGASDSNDGLSELTSWASVGHAMQNVSDLDRVNVNAGDYWLGGWDSVTAGAGAAYIGVNGEVNIWACAEDDSSNFTADPTYTNTYAMPTATGYGVWDMSVDNPHWTEHAPGMPNLGWMSLQTSAANVDANPGSFYYDSTGDVMYVHTHDSRAPDSDVKVMTLDDLRVGVDDATEYWQGINFLGYEVETYAFRDDATIGFYQCKFGYTYADNLITARGRTECYIYLEDCFAFSTYRDAYSSRQSPYVVMINCVGGDAPISGSNNATTSHDDGHMIRLGGTYYDCGYLVLADIQTGLSLNVAVSSYKTYAGDSNSADFYFLDCEPYMIRCNNAVTGGSQSQSAVSGTASIGSQGNEVPGLIGSGITFVDNTYYVEPA